MSTTSEHSDLSDLVVTGFHESDKLKSEEIIHDDLVQISRNQHEFSIG
jgi:hypothetical protein